MRKVAFHNLGCKVNSYETDVMQQMLLDKGYELVAFDQRADIYIVNTCTVTNIADRKSRQMLHRAKQNNPDAVVVAVGCYVQTGKEQVLTDNGVDLAIGNNRKKDIVALLEEFLEKKSLDNAKTLGNKTILDIDHTYEYEEMCLTKTAEHTRAYIKIQDGCNQFCSYCAIPLARGRVRSRRVEDIIHEIKTMVKAGYKEIVLTGIHISSYGIDFEDEGWKMGQCVRRVATEERVDYSGESKLIDLIERIHDIPGLMRIRIGSLEPRIITETNAARLGKLPKVCPHFHLSLQSGCDAVLKRMNRHYTTEEYAQSVALLRKAFDHPAITTDVIVGFPGETEEEFQMTKDFLKQIAFFEMHIFKYSKRNRTRAVAMPMQVSEQIKSKRSEELLALEREQSVDFRKRYSGSKAMVLLEEEKVIEGKNYLLGHTADYVKVAILKRSELMENQIYETTVKEFLSEDILLGL